MADLSNRLHVLLLLVTIAIYTVTAFGWLALGAHINHSTLWILRAIERFGGRLKINLFPDFFVTYNGKGINLTG